MNTFNPDLVIEVTSVCNRACKGCYAPNVVSKESASELLQKDPGLFIDPVVLQGTLLSLRNSLPGIISIRGGEPSLHPNLASILNTTKFFAPTVVIETHGRWLLNGEREAYQELILSIMENRTTLKISFDSMHALKTEDLQEIISFLQRNSIDYYVAITEEDLEKFAITRNSILWIKDEKIIYQRKASRNEELLRPRLGVLNSKGELRDNLNSKFHGAALDLVSLTLGNAAG